MISAGQCYEGLEDWEKSQIWIARTAVRYQNQSLQWIFWCARTGKGSFDEAKEVAEEYVKAMGKQFTGTDLLEMAFFYTITQQHRKSLDVYERMYKENRIESRALFLGIAADDCDNKERRNQVWKDWPKKGTPWADLGALFERVWPKERRRDSISKQWIKLSPVFPPTSNTMSTITSAAFFDITARKMPEGI